MSDEFGPDTVVVASQQQVSAEVDGEAVILGMDRGEYYGLDPVGTRIWQLVQSPVSVAQIQDALVAEYDVTADQCLADLQALLNQMRQEGLIEIAA